MVVDRDDGIRPDFSFEKLSKLRACFKKGGTTTVGNACQVPGRWPDQAARLRGCGP